LVLQEGILTLTVISVIVGAALAVAYYVLSLRLHRWAAKRRFMMLPLITISGFVVRLIVFVGILAILGLWSPLNILAVCLSFVVLFTVFNGIWLYALATNRHGTPPSAGATGPR
jgi:hypothetical protein